MIDVILGSLEEALVTCGHGPVAQQRVRLVSSPFLAALRRTGTARVYGRHRGQ